MRDHDTRKFSFDGYEFPYELVLDNALVGICFVVDRRLLWTNARMNEMFGYPEGALNGHSVRVLYATQEAFEAVGRKFELVSRHGRYTHELEMKRRNGETFWCTLSGQWIDPGHATAPAVWVLQDITARLRAEDQLRRANQRLEQTVEARTRSLQRTNVTLSAEVDRRRAAQLALTESREKYRTLFRNLPLGLLVTDAQGTATEINRVLQRSIAARSRSHAMELLENDALVLTDDGTTSLATLLKRHVTGDRQGIDRFEFHWRTGTGAVREIAVTAAPLRSHGLGATFAFVDVTRQRRAAERERQQQEALAHASRLSLMGQMASALAHELGQPLNACQSYVGGLQLRLQHGGATFADVQLAIDKIAGHLERATEIMRNVRAFVSRRPVPQVETDLGALLRKTLALMEPQLRAAQVRPEVRADADLPPVRCNAVEIQQVLVNLLMNALDAMQDTPVDERRLEIRLEREKNAMLGVVVRDTGAGIPADVAARLFEPYFTTKPTGLGMGLMICRNIVESHGGALRLVASRCRGTSFKFTLRTVER
ncbi:MAG: PAS domain S-box protein [Betaproteobacteria bacterium]|nr:MAG: PAS domain S-box protein [Betaproteobacteria bacterium]